MTEFKKGDKIRFDGNYWIVEKTAPGKILLKGYGFRKWFPAEEVNRNAKMEKMK